jgi:hypothetical protein
MGFFASFPPPEPPKRPRRPLRPPWRGPERKVVPCALAVDAVLLRNATKALYVNGFDVYPYGFAFLVNTLLRESAVGEVRSRSFLRTANPFDGLSPRGGEPPAPQEIERAFRIGVRFADGRSAEVEGRGGWRDGTRPPEPPSVGMTSGHGSEGEWTQGLWVWGIPEAGDVEVVYRWPAEQVADSSLTLDGDLLRDAAARAVTLWDESDDEGGEDAHG